MTTPTVVAENHSISTLRGSRTAVDALWIVGGLALLRLLLHLSLNTRYDFHRDEMALVDYARRLDWGFVEFPPLTPAAVAASMAIFGDTVWGARVLSALAMSLVVLLAGLMARSMGGGRGAQILSAAAAFASVYGLLMGSMTLYASFDTLWWVLVAYFLVQRVATDEPRWWLAVGAAIGVGLMTKYTMLILAAAVAVALLVEGRLRRDLRTPWPWLGAGLALLLVSPNLIWQARHGWVAFEFTAAIHARDVAWGRADGYWIEQLFANASPVALPLWIAGLVWLVAARGGRTWRFLAWLYLLPLVAFGLLEGRAYYVAAPYIWLCVAGAVAWEVGVERLEGRMRSAAIWATGALAAAAMVLGALLVLPWPPINSPAFRLTGELTDIYREQLIWPELAQTVATVYASVPDPERAATAIVTGNYGEAGAINWYGPALGLPRAVSPINTYWLWGWGDPAAPPQQVILVGIPPGDVAGVFSGCRAAASVPNPQAIANEETRWHATIYHCTGVRRPWPEIWDAGRGFG